MKFTDNFGLCGAFGLVGLIFGLRAFVLVVLLVIVDRKVVLVKTIWRVRSRSQRELINHPSATLTRF